MKAKHAVLIAVAIFLLVLLIQAGADELPFKTHEWTDGHGRVCTATYLVKIVDRRPTQGMGVNEDGTWYQWVGDEPITDSSIAVDCDWPQTWSEVPVAEPVNLGEFLESTTADCWSDVEPGDPHYCGNWDDVTPWDTDGGLNQ